MSNRDYRICAWSLGIGGLLGGSIMDVLLYRTTMLLALITTCFLIAFLEGLFALMYMFVLRQKRHV